MAPSKIHQLAKDADVGALKELLATDAGRRDLLLEDDVGLVPLHQAARHLDPAAAKEMLEAQDGALAFNQLHVKSGDTYACYPIHRACYAGAWDVAKLMMKYADGDRFDCLTEPDADGYLPVQYAKIAGRNDVVEQMMGFKGETAKIKAHIETFDATKPKYVPEEEPEPAPAPVKKDPATEKADKEKAKAADKRAAEKAKEEKKREAAKAKEDKKRADKEAREKAKREKEEERERAKEERAQQREKQLEERKAALLAKKEVCHHDVTGIWVAFF